MRIAFLNSIEKETFGGMEEWIRLVGHGLARRGHKITFIGRENSEYLRRCKTDDKNVTMLQLRIGGDFDPSTISKIKAFLADARIDYLTVNFNKDIRLGGLAARWQGQTKVVWSVGLDITKNSLVHKVLTPRLLDSVIVPSESLKSEITSLGYIDPADVTVIPIGIENISLPDKTEARSTVLSEYSLPNDAVLAVTSGRFVDQKGHDVLVDAIPGIISKVPGLRFLFLGDGPNKEMLKKKIQDLGLTETVVFCGMIDEVNNTLAGADVMLHPSRFEPFGIAVLEGMRAGLPVIASKVGGIPEVVAENKNATLVKAEEPEELTKAVNELLDDAGRMQQFGRAGRKRYEDHFTWERMLDRVEQHYQAIELTTGSGQRHG